MQAALNPVVCAPFSSLLADYAQGNCCKMAAAVLAHSGTLGRLRNLLGCSTTAYSTLLHS